MAELIVVTADFMAFSCLDDVTGERLKEGFTEEKLIETGKVYKYLIDMRTTSYVLTPGGKLLMAVARNRYPLRIVLPFILR
jgi:hypothetical protein